MVGSTAAVDARDNTGTTFTTNDKGVPIYWLNGAKAADDYEDFYDESWDDEANDKNESGTNGPDTSNFNNYPGTGSNHNGTEAFLGSSSLALGASTVRLGQPNSSDHGPISSDHVEIDTSGRHPLYGLSDVLTVVAANATGTLSALTLADASDNTAIPLSPTFLAGTTTYQAWVGNDVESVTLTATQTNSAATVAITDDDDTSTAGEAGFDLDEGVHTLEVTVTSEDGNTEGTYIITLVREASAPTADPDAVWTANLTVGIGEDSGGDPLVGYAFLLGETSYGAIAPATFDIDSYTLGVTEVQYDDADSLRFSYSAFDPFATLGDANYVLHVGNQSFEIAGASNLKSFEFTDAGLTWTYGEIVPVKLVEADAGELTITGTAQVGNTLTADTSNITDPDGLTNVDYDYQWIRADSDGANPENIGSDSVTYTLVAEDAGKKIKVKVTFTDDANNDEELTSDAYPSKGYSSGPLAPVVIQAERAACPENNHWCAELTVGVGTKGTQEIYGFDDGASIGALDDTAFDYAGTTYTVSEYSVGETLLAHVLFLQLDTFLPRQSRIYLNEQLFFTAAASEQPTTGRYYLIGISLLSMVDGQKITVAAKLPNAAATGKPAISGSPTVGQALTAGKGAITDPNGLTKADNGDTGYAYAYQWVRVDADGTSNATNIGSNSNTYTLVAPDAGKRIKVKVSFTDDAGNDEGPLTSDAFPSGTISTVPNEPATGKPAISGTAQVRETLTAHTTGITDANGLSNPGYSYQWIGVDADGTSNPTNIGSDSGAYTLMAADAGKRVRVRVSFTDDAGFDEELTSDAFPSGTIRRVPNSPATGKPTISGTPTVGRTLSASTAGITDANGLSNARYSFQWIRVDGATETIIPGATSTTYRLLPAVEGKRIRVRVDFTDDDGYMESLTSDATSAVERSTRGDDFVSADTLTTSSIAVGESWLHGNAVVGAINHWRDNDWYSTELQRNHCYQIEVRGSDTWEDYQEYPADDPIQRYAPTQELTLSDPLLRGLYNSNGDYIEDTENDDGGSNLDALKTVRPSVGGTYYLGVSHGWYNDGGTFDLSVIDLGTVTRTCTNIP